MNVNSWLKKAKQSISPLDAELILKDVLNFDDRSTLVLHENRELTPAELTVANQLLSRRQSGEPLAYLLGYRDFYGRPFKVTPDVLIPRPETETIITMLNERLRKPYACSFEGVAQVTTEHERARPVTTGSSDASRKRIMHTENLNLSILDIGTGSGCLAITLALELPDSQVTALDISNKALKIAKENAKHLYARNITFQQSDLLENYSGPKPNIIVANLPYVDKNWDWTSPEITHEPALALYADHHGLALIYRLLDEIKQKWYNSNHNDYPLYLYLEADPCQHQEIITFAKQRNFRLLNQKDYILAFEF